MAKYRVTYHIHERKRITHSPLTGKEYKRPRTERNWISLTEILKFDTLKEALNIARNIAKNYGWTLDGVEEV